MRFWGLSLAFGLLASLSQGQETSLISVSTSGQLANGASDASSVSAEGRYVAFDSAASTLVPGDTNGRRDIFVRDRQLSTTVRVSLTSSGGQANQDCVRPSISADGRFVFFFSRANNLYPGANGYTHLYRFDRSLGLLELVSASSTGEVANEATFEMDVSASGRFVVFSSTASNLVASDTNQVKDIFVRDMLLGTTIRASMSYLGTQAQQASNNPSISDDGMAVAFDSQDYTLAFDDTNNFSDIFVRDLVAGTTIRASMRQNGQQALNNSYDPILAADGRSVVFESDDSFGFPSVYGQIYHKDLLTGAVERISVTSSGVAANSTCESWESSQDLRFTAFRSSAGNLNAGQFSSHAYVHDRVLRRTVPVSIGTSGALGEAAQVSLSRQGHFAVFSTGSSLDPADTNGQRDIYLHSLGDVRPTLQSLVLVPKSVRGGKPVVATAQLVNPAPVFGFTADVSSANPNIAGAPNLLEFAPGEISKQFEVATTGVDADIDVVITVSGPQNSVQDLLTVRRATVFSVTSALASIVGGNQLQGTVVLDGKAGPQTALVRMTDNSPHLLMSTYCVVPSGQSEANFTIWTYGVGAPTAVTISAYYNGTTKQTTLTLTPASLNVIWVVPTQVIGGSPSMGNVRLTGKAPAGGFLVTLSSDDTSAANMASSTTVAHGADLKQFPISTFGVDLTKNVTITAVAQGVTRTATLQVRPATLDSITVAVSTLQGGSSTTGTVFLTGKAGPLGRTVVLSSNKPEVIVPATMYIPPQRNSWSFGVTSTAVVSSVTATITASQGGLTRTVEVTVTP